MEEASVAGESPDSSKQRESSAEPTSGSASPVPEARSAASARDPRLAVARESESGRPDTATRVLSVKERSEDAEERPEEASGPTPAESARQAASEDPARREERDGTEGGDGAGTAGDERLRAAVAAWVTSGSGQEGADEDGSAEEAEARGGRAEDRGEEPEDAEADTEADSDTDSDSDSAGAGQEGTGTEAGAEDANDSAQDAQHDTGDAEPGAQEDARDTPGAAERTRDGAQDDSPADAEPARETEPSPDAGPRPASGTRTTGGPATGPATGTTTGPSPEPAPGPTAEPAAEPAAEKDPGGTEDARKAPAAKSSPAAAPEDGAPPVDQPTAVFRAVKPAVDQPTTMLKLGDARNPAPAPEPDAERTSKFVALKPLDDPSTRKPPPAADATTAPPKVSSDKPKAPAGQTAVVPQVGPERTTQQPLPPKPPLDLLAELTNTPPPPETPLRTAVRRVKIWTPLVLLLVVVFAIAQAVRPLPTPTLELTAEESYSFEGDGAGLPWPGEGQGWMDVNGIGTMGNFGEQKPVAIGSVAKAMTAYVVLKKHPLKSGEEGPKIPVDALAEKEGGYNLDGESTLNTVKEGDQITLRQALSAIMIPSANNIARLLARWDSGTEAAFIKKMNEAAEELGMENTTYTDASGLKESTVSTAEDQVKLGNELVQDRALMEITAMGEWIDPSGQKWYNYNKLVPYDGGIGIKTGTTTAAGGNLLFASRKEVGGETVTVVGAILGQHKAPIIETVNEVSKTAMLAAQDALASAKILKKGDVVGYVDDRLGGRTPVVVTQDVTAVGWAGHEVQLSFTAGEVPHTAKAGTKVGTLTVGDGSGGAVEVPVALQSDLAEPAFTDKLTRVF
ncbi:D-alanyl-D-alanine carboxypeptidase [Streptomyces sp. NPDC047706]|uniref:D-alanyl-D-alanine carboxypeptidase n=1 Tax=Streptomyces sp. NPDC047706 TaxID=3365486 RepID=UPI00371012CC